MKKLDLIGKKFNKLLVINKVEHNNKYLWECLCDCGNKTYVLTSNLTCGRTKSCGCLKNESLIKRSTTHNQRHTNLYEVWKTMKQRCYNSKNKSYKNYGGRGISICPQWKNDFSSFYLWSKNNGYAKGLTIDRIDNNGNYCPENCRWVTRKVQANNTRFNRFITINNQTKSLADWCRLFNLKYSCVHSRLSKGWSIKDALTKNK